MGQFSVGVNTEDTYFTDRSDCERICELIRRQGPTHPYNPQNELEVSQILLKFLKTEREARRSKVDWVLGPNEFDTLSNISAADDAVNKYKTQLLGPTWSDISARFIPGNVLDGVILNPHPIFGIFVELEPGISGLIARNSLRMDISAEDYKNLSGEKVRVELLSVDPIRKRISLKLLTLLEDD